MKFLILGLITILSAQLAQADKLVFLDGEVESLQARLDFATDAKTIKAQYFTVDDDFVSSASIAYLMEVANKGTKVQIIVDSMHNLMKKEKMAAIMLNHKNQSNPNIEIREYNQFNPFKPFLYTKRMHDKGLIIEDKNGNQVMISGGRNIADGYFGKSPEDRGSLLPIYEDSDILVMESKSIESANQYFDDLWKSSFVKEVRLFEFSRESLDPRNCSMDSDTFQCESHISFNKKVITKEEQKLQNLANEVIAGKHDAKVNPVSILQWGKRAVIADSIEFIFDNPNGQKSDLTKPHNSIADQLYKHIAQAKKSVTIVSPYFIVTPEQEALFKKLKENNIKVRVITNGKRSNDVPSAHLGYIKERHKALEQGVEIREYNGPDTLHAKMVLIDRTKLFIGSFNWDYRSQNLNREVGIVAQLVGKKDNELTTDVYKKFSRLFLRSTKLGDQKKLNLDAGDYTQDKLDDLAAQIKNANNNILFWNLVYPLIKEQL